MPAPAQGSVRSIVRERFLNVVREVQPANGWKVLVVDSASVKLLSCAVRTLDILEEGVSLVENLEIRRQPMATMEAIYLIAPSEASISKIKEDFQDADKCMYAAAHIYLTSHLPNDLIYSLKQCELLVSRCKTLRELNLEFSSVEAQAYHLGLPEAFNTLYSPMSIAKNALLHSMVERLASLCVTLGEMPNIRYLKRKESGAGSEAAETIAKALSASMSNFEKQVGDKNTWWQPQHAKPATILILDRAVDALSPLMHEYTYQAMVYDIVGVGDGVKDGKYTYTSTNSKGQPVAKEVALNDDDPLWVQLKHMHIADAINHVIDDFNAFLKENKAANLAKGEATDLKDLSEAIKSMPQYKELLSKYSMHIDLTKKCMAQYEKMQLEIVSTQEQNMATKGDVSGKPIEFVHTLEGVLAVVNRADISDEIKLRLIMIFVISQDGVEQGHIDQLILAASLKDPYAAKKAVANLSHLHVKHSKAPELPKSMKDKSLEQMSKLFPFAKSEIDSERRPKDTDVAYDLSRYRPPLQYIMQDALEGKLSEAEFPHAGDTARPAPTSGVTKERPKASWATAKSGVKESDLKKQAARAGPRLIVFVVGGMCYSEVRAAYELTKKYDREVIIGSSEVFAPARYLELLTSLSESPL
mmetsp:Transcript_85736/g.125463  ORF Transcript_85736/g.125463 Transcript_85736/m.125463 type:complete len:642 (+) Transcript_85736:75-2000(+)|eukprot:CAMPEP_0179429484 /NCGR_PEP_ID=MMETSP0799-20121207/14847_1 /TAXON_ID=46947 /ORGANISM="Geminigera cryophila, Strain CCMP2564" /LENGTH=641 /DNA_ID=CAMNT_0021205407 /DNA_START=53 /DNA_END=1978 /DNA_ORIENTATION=+